MTRLPGRHNRPNRHSAREDDEFSWFWGCVAAWAVMLGALAASASLIGDTVFLLKVGILLIVAFPAAYYLHFSRVSRWTVNWVVFYLAIGLGTVEFVLGWPAEGFRAFYGLHASFAFLVKGFLWVMVFRAFALRTLTDLVLTIIPAVSCVMLALLGHPTALAMGGVAVLILAALYLLATEYRVETEQTARRAHLRSEATHALAPRRGPSVNTWQAIAVVVLVAAIIAGAGASYLEFSTSIARNMQTVLAQYLAGYLIRERIDYTPEPLLYLGWASPPMGDRVLFVVECERGENWRQQVYAEYDGRTWKQARSRSVRGRREGSVWKLDTSEVSGFRSERAVTVKQKFNVKAPIAGILPGLFLAVEVSADERRFRTGEGGTLICSGYLGPGDSYEVTSLVPAEGSTPRDNPLPPPSEDLLRQYLQLPPDLPARIRELAVNVTDEARNQQDAALMIQNHLSDTYPYDLRPEPLPSGRDFVAHFLFEGKSGYCLHYASAMAVMCRSIGFPARLVTGFVPGELDPDTDTYEVREKDGHSWAEVYIEGRGWQSFEPTPPSEEEDTENILAALWEKTVAGISGAAQTGWALARRHKWSVIALALAIACLLVVVLMRRRLGLGLGSPGPFGPATVRGSSPSERAVLAYEEMGGWLSRLGLPRRPTKAPLEYLASLPARAEAILPDASEITAHYLRARFGGSGIAEREACAAESALGRLHGLLFRDGALEQQG